MQCMWVGIYAKPSLLLGECGRMYDTPSAVAHKIIHPLVSIAVPGQARAKRAPRRQLRSLLNDLGSHLVTPLG